MFPPACQKPQCNAVLNQLKALGKNGLFIQCFWMKTQSMTANPQRILFNLWLLVEAISTCHWSTGKLCLALYLQMFPLGINCFFIRWPDLCTAVCWWSVHDHFRNVAICMGNCFPTNSEDVQMCPKVMSRFFTLNREVNKVVKYLGQRCNASEQFYPKKMGFCHQFSRTL